MDSTPSASGTKSTFRSNCGACGRLNFPPRESRPRLSRAPAIVITWSALIAPAFALWSSITARSPIIPTAIIPMRRGPYGRHRVVPVFA